MLFETKKSVVACLLALAAVSVATSSPGGCSALDNDAALVFRLGRDGTDVGPFSIPVTRYNGVRCNQVIDGRAGCVLSGTAHLRLDQTAFQARFPFGSDVRTLCGFGRMSRFAGTWGHLMAYGRPDSAHGWNIAAGIPSDATAAVLSSFAGDINVAEEWSLNAWHHQCGVYTGTTMRLYFDGVIIGSRHLDIDTTKTNANSYIGAQIFDKPAEFFQGALSELRLYSRVLTHAEILELSTAASYCVVACPPLQQPANGFALPSDQAAVDTVGNVTCKSGYACARDTRILSSTTMAVESKPAWGTSVLVPSGTLSVNVTYLSGTWGCGWAGDKCTATAGGYGAGPCSDCALAGGEHMALIGRFDRPDTPFMIGLAAELAVPTGATALFMAPNDQLPWYNDNWGRLDVEISFRSESGAYRTVCPLRCLSNGSWSPSARTCEARRDYCYPRAGPDYGAASSVDAVPVDTVVTFSCDPGYVMTGASAATCTGRELGRGEWSHDVPSCRRLDVSSGEPSTSATAPEAVPGPQSPAPAPSLPESNAASSLSATCTARDCAACVSDSGCAWCLDDLYAAGGVCRPSHAVTDSQCHNRIRTVGYCLEHQVWAYRSALWVVLPACLLVAAWGALQWKRLRRANGKLHVENDDGQYHGQLSRRSFVRAV